MHFYRFNEKQTQLWGFSRGWNKALAAIILNESHFFDSKRMGGSVMDLEKETGFLVEKDVWNHSGVIAEIIYDILDTNNEESDQVNIAFKWLYRLMKNKKAMMNKKRIKKE
jgi:hypothetical protein